MNDINKKQSSEDYLERIVMLEKNGLERVKAIDLARSLSFSRPSVSIALKKLENEGFVEVNPEFEIKLTPAGRKIGEDTCQKHEIIGSILVSLGVDEQIAYEDSCRIEHVISDESFNALKKHYSEHK